MFNRVFLIGNLAKDPDLRYTPSGIPVVRFAVAVNRPKNKSNPEKNEVDFINIVAWRRLAEICGEFLKKGRPVSIEGRLQIRNYEKDGEQRTMAEVIADGMQMLGRRPDNAGASSTEKAPASQESKSDDIPF
ncbi:single-stranded DNA-binding protein [Candidatus Margulisiibacteriota bacterium]